MTDVAELGRRKEPLNLAIVHVDPQAFSAHYLGWLEITAFVAAQRAGAVKTPEDGMTPSLSEAQLYGETVGRVAEDALFAFCMTASLEADPSAVDAVESALTARFGRQFPGVSALARFRETVETPATLDEFVGQAGRKLLQGELPPPPLRAKESWNTGLRFFEKARKSNFVHEIIYPLAKWTRASGEEILEKGVAFLHHIEDNVPSLRDALKDPRNDRAFIANYLLKLAPAVDMELNEEYEGLLRSVARRV